MARNMGSMWRVITTQPSIEQMLEAFLDGPIVARMSPMQIDAVRDVFRLGAMFAIFALLEALDNPQLSPDDLEAYHGRLEAECREWVEQHRAVAEAAKGDVH